MYLLIPEFSELPATKLKYLPTFQLHIPKSKVKNLRIGDHFLGSSTANSRELKQTRTETATKTPSNNRFNEQNNSSAHAYKSLYISLPSSAKQQRERTEF